MFNFFSGIVSTLGIVIDFVVSAVQMVIMLFTQIPAALGFLTVVTAYLPPFLLTFVSLFVAVCVILNIINKGG